MSGYNYVFILLSSFSVKCAFGQSEAEKYDTVTSYVHIKPAGYDRPQNVIGFIMDNLDTLGTPNWRSGTITDFEKYDRWSYFVKINIPSVIMKNSRELWCSMLVARENDTVQFKYGGVQLSRIELFLKSSPEGAETFLIPNSIWTSKVDNLNWKKDNSIIEKYRVNTSPTNTKAIVDETVFVVIFKMGSKFKKVIHYTKPERVEREQTVWIKF